MRSGKFDTYLIDYSILRGLRHILDVFPGYLINDKVPVNSTKLQTVEAGTIDNIPDKSLCFTYNDKDYCTLYSHQNSHLITGVKLGLDGSNCMELASERWVTQKLY